MGTGGLSRQRLGRMHQVMAGHVEGGYVPGLVTLIDRRGEVHVDAVGALAFGGDAPMRRDTTFRIRFADQAGHGGSGHDPGRGVQAAPRRSGRRVAARVG